MNTQPNQQQTTNGQVPILRTFNDKEYRIFKPITMIETMDIVKKHQKQKKKEGLKMTAALKKKVDMNDQAKITMDDNHSIHIQDGSIKDFLNTCHSDVRKYLNEHEPHSIKVQAGRLIILTRDNYRIIITVKGHNSREIIITDKNRKTVCKEISIFETINKKSNNGNYNK